MTAPQVMSITECITFLRNASSNEGEFAAIRIDKQLLKQMTIAQEFSESIQVFCSNDALQSSKHGKAAASNQGQVANDQGCSIPGKESEAKYFFKQK